MSFEDTTVIMGRFLARRDDIWRAHPCQQIWIAAGRPGYPIERGGVCRTCGVANEAGLRFDDWVKPTFTDHDKLVPGDVVCRACQFCFDEASADLATRVGKPEPQRMRNYSHFVTDAGVWVPLSKGDKAKMRELLPTARVVVIAATGQRHLIFRAVAGCWQFEEQRMQPTPSLICYLVATMTRLLRVFSKQEIESRRYESRRIGEYGITQFVADEEIIGEFRGTPAFALALFLAQREEQSG